MSMIFIAKGVCHLGQRQKDKNGNVVKETPAKFAWDNAGGSIAIGKMDPNSKEIYEDTVSIYGDWDAAGYIEEMLKLLQPARTVNIPDLKKIVQTAYQEDGNDLLCDYCKSMNCRNCIIKEWKEELE